jgi:2-phosphosulfolactate phosphatase
MHIRRLALAEGAADATGDAVIIDVFRAFTCEPLMVHLGAARIILEAEPERCLAYKPDAILVGERNEVPLPGFDLTNSPSLILKTGRPLFAGRTVVHRTTSGVTGALAALERADRVHLASFINARAVVKAIRRHDPAVVSIVAMGIRSLAPAPEDEACGDYLEHLLTGRPFDPLAALATILAHETAQKFLRGDKDYLPKEDPALCLQMDLLDIPLAAVRRDGRVEAVWG